MALTRRQKQVLDYLVKFIDRKRYSPSFEEIAEGLNLSSVATVHKHLDTLERKGFIKREYNRSRSVEVVAVPGQVPFAKIALEPFRGGKSAAPRRAAVNGSASSPLTLLDPMEFPLLGRIAAGHPVEAVSTPETFSFADFTRRRDGIFVLKVKGDSMVDDHICDGDYILVEGGAAARNGDIVVALLGGTDATLKRFFIEPDGKIRLQPANAQMDPIVVDARDVEIQGRVIGVLRRY
jgi:repressor LexA